MDCGHNYLFGQVMLYHNPDGSVLNKQKRKIKLKKNKKLNNVLDSQEILNII